MNWAKWFSWSSHVDLATTLVVLMVVSGLIWFYDKIYLAPQRARARTKLSVNVSKGGQFDAEHIPLWVDLARSLFPVFLIVLILRSFLVEPFRIPSGSMMPTLLIGDFILVNKFSYGLHLPVTNQKIIDFGRPQRGDVVVFRYPEDPSIPYIKRVIGLPGDHISYQNEHKVVYINGNPVAQEMLGIFQGMGSGSGETGAEKRIETLPRVGTPPETVDHEILVKPGRLTQGAEFNDLTLPEGHYFVLGDNRDNSRDSRYWGTVPEENLIGKAFFIWMNFDFANANGRVNWQRVGMRIQ